MTTRLLSELITLLHTNSVGTPEEAEVIVRWDNDTVAVYEVPLGSSVAESIQGYDAICIRRPGEDSRGMSSGELLKAGIYDLADDDYVPPASLAWRQKFLSGRTRELIERLKGKKFFDGSSKFPGRVPLSACLGGEERHAAQIALIERSQPN